MNPRTKTDTEYLFDLRAGVQRNSKSGWEKRIRRSPPYDPAIFALVQEVLPIPAPPVDVKWEFAEGEQWRLFDRAAVGAVEGALNNCQPVVQSTFVNGRTQKETVYKYDLARMLQTNTTTTFTRAIRRSVKQQ